MVDVFISYASEDKATADAACAALEAAGVGCWIAPRNIVPGMKYGEAIVDAVGDIKIMVIVFSSYANASPFVEREVERAVSRGIPVIPMRIENVDMSKSLKFFLSASQWLDAMTPPLKQHLAVLVASVRALLEVRAPGAAIRGVYRHITTVVVQPDLGTYLRFVNHQVRRARGFVDGSGFVHRLLIRLLDLKTELKSESDFLNMTFPKIVDAMRDMSFRWSFASGLAPEGLRIELHVNSDDWTAKFDSIARDVPAQYAERMELVREPFREYLKKMSVSTIPRGTIASLTLRPSQGSFDFLKGQPGRGLEYELNPLVIEAAVKNTLDRKLYWAEIFRNSAPAAAKSLWPRRRRPDSTFLTDDPDGLVAALDADTVRY